MKILLLSIGLCAALAARGEDLAKRYAAQGEWILIHLATAPFPHPKRAAGHEYKDRLYPTQEHYSDNTVAIFVPKGFQERGAVDFVIYFHGWKANVANVLARHKLIEQLVESRRNAVLVVPQGPLNAPDSFGGKLEDPNGFKRFMDDVAATLRQKVVLPHEDFAVGQIVLSGHSGGYQVISAILDHGGMTEHVRGVWLFDALYAQTDRFLAWIDRKQGRFIDIYTDRGGTKAETEKLMATLKQRGTVFFAAEERETKPTDLQTNKLIFLHTDLTHNEVIQTRQEFRDYLETSCFRELE